MLRWVNSQLGRILGWVERAIQQEASTQLFLPAYFLNLCFFLLPSIQDKGVGRGGEKKRKKKKKKEKKRKKRKKGKNNKFKKEVGSCIIFKI